MPANSTTRTPARQTQRTEKALPFPRVPVGGGGAGLLPCHLHEMAGPDHRFADPVQPEGEPHNLTAT